MVSIETVTACNRRCAYCPNSRFDRGLPANARRMETRLFHKIIDELSGLAARGWAGDVQPNLYGEPLLDERLPELVRYARRALPKSPISLFTNGDLLDPPRYRELADAGVTRFVVTRHSAEVPAGIAAVLKLREGGADPGVKFFYGPLAGPISNKGGLVEVDSPAPPRDCAWSASTIGVYHDGRAAFCCNDYFGSVQLGDISRESLLAVWKKPEYRRLRRELRRGVYRLDICKKCRLGGVPAGSRTE